MPFLIAAVISGLVTAVQTFTQMEAQRRQNEYQAQVARNNALAKDQEAELRRQQTEIEERAKEREQRQLKHQYREAAGTNMSLLAAGNVDLTSGSALDLLEGNYNRYADDMGELEYEKILTRYTGDRDAEMIEWEGDVFESNASFYESSAGSVGRSLLTAGLSGAGTGMSTYMSAGGTFGSGYKAPKPFRKIGVNPIL